VIMRTERPKATGETLPRLLDSAASCLRRAQKNRHSLNGSGYYAKTYMNTTVDLRCVGESVAQELDRSSRSDQATRFRLALQKIATSTSFKDAASALTELRAAWYATAGLQLASRRLGRAAATIFLPPELRAHVPGYLKPTFDQIQGCYASRYYDAALVMIRRLFESLIIEGYVAAGKDSEIKSNGEYVPFTELVGRATSGELFQLARDGKRALRTVKSLGDNAAHNPHFSGQASDLDRLRNEVRVLMGDLLSNIATLQRRTTASAQAGPDVRHAMLTAEHGGAP